MADVVVDYGMLGTSADQLNAVKSFIDGLESRVSGSSDCWGNQDIAGAMNTFATNWSYHREKLSDLVGSVAEKFEKTASTWRENDEHEAQLAAHLVSQGSK